MTLRALLQRAFRLWFCASTAWTKPSRYMLLHKQATNQALQLYDWSMLYYRTSVHMSRNCTYDLGEHTPGWNSLLSSVYQDNIFLWISSWLWVWSEPWWHRRNPYFPCPPPQSGMMAQCCFHCHLIQEQCLGSAEIIRINFCSRILNVAGTQDSPAELWSKSSAGGTVCQKANKSNVEEGEENIFILEKSCLAVGPVKSNLVARSKGGSWFIRKCMNWTGKAFYSTNNASLGPKKTLQWWIRLSGLCFV